MSHRKKQTPNPEPQAQAQPPEPGPEQPEETSLSDGLQSLIDSLDENHPARGKVLEELEKLKEEQRKSEEAKLRTSFDEDLKQALTEILTGENGLLEKYPIDMSKRKLVITFPPEGSGSFSLSDLDVKASPGRKKTGNGFKSSWGKAVLKDGDDTTEYESPSKLAAVLGLKVNGHSDMTEVFTKPISAETGEPADVGYTVDAERGVRFIVTKQ